MEELISDSIIISRLVNMRFRNLYDEGPTLEIPFERIMEMRKKLYILSFTVEGFDQIGADDPNDDNGPTHISVDDDNKELEDEEIDKDILDGGEDPIDDLDLANRPNSSKKPPHGK